ncbi:deoxyribodipyrimidine photo-lyase [Kribbella sp. NPDC059898]|uniref:deoxyribodipyrimidine photo-lyase n=1 Tax=Kribbella sp. NPDC059898 TaxID=3346995 RepID=UPI00364E41E7
MTTGGSSAIDRLRYYELRRKFVKVRVGSMAPAVMWFRRDLRLADNPALLEAVEAGGGHVAGLFVLDSGLWDPAGSPRRNRLLSSVQSLSEAMGGSLVVRRGDPAEMVPRFAAEIGAGSVHIATDYRPYGRRRDAAVERRLGCPLVRTGSPYAVSTGRIVTNAGAPYQVFTPYFRA